jgi:hypothetical protein
MLTRRAVDSPPPITQMQPVGMLIPVTAAMAHDHGE